MKRSLIITSLLFIAAAVIIPLFSRDLRLMTDFVSLCAVYLMGRFAGFIIKHAKPDTPDGLRKALGFLTGGVLCAAVYLAQMLLLNSIAPLTVNLLFPPILYGGIFSLITLFIHSRSKKTPEKPERKGVSRFLRGFVKTVVMLYLLLFVFINWGVTEIVRPVRPMFSGNELMGKVTPLTARDGPPRLFPLREASGIETLSNGRYPADLRFLDLSALDLTNEYDALMFADFSGRTVWPDKLPPGFSPELITELGMNPGLGIRELHNRGITGANVGIAIIDQNLPVRHAEYAESLRLYEGHFADWFDGPGAAMHSFTASLAAGRNAGVAPGADLYYITGRIGNIFFPGLFISNYHYVVSSIDRIIEINRCLPEDRKIRAVSISRGFELFEPGARALKSAIDRADEEGIFVITCSPDVNFGFILRGLGRDPLADPDDVLSYAPGLFIADGFYRNNEAYNEDVLWVPMDSRAGASFMDEVSYDFYRSGGLSWTAPWLAGLYALCAQVYPPITPDLFIELAFETGDEIYIEKDGVSYRLKTIVNPAALVERLENTSPN